jgi:hypothetical protein
MKCDDFLKHLSTGNFVQRALARLHAKKCPNCRRAAERLADLRRELAEAPPLSDRQSELWMSAVTATRSETEHPSPARPAPPRRARNLPPALAVAAVVVAIALVAVPPWIGPDNTGATGPGGVANGPKEIVQDSTAESVRQIADLRGSLESLARKLDELESQASLLDERMVVAEIVRPLPPQ